MCLCFFFCFIFMSFRLDFSGCRALLFLSLCTRWPKHYYLFISVLLTVKWKQLLLSALRWQARTWLDLCAQVVSTVQKTENNHKFELLESAASTTRCFSYLGETNALEHNCKHTVVVYLFVCHSSSGWQIFFWNSCYVRESPFIDKAIMTSNLTCDVCSRCCRFFFFCYFTFLSFVLNLPDAQRPRNDDDKYVL